MNQRKPIGCPTQTPAKLRLSSSTSRHSCTPSGKSMNTSASYAMPIFDDVIEPHARLGCGAEDATRMGKHRIGDLDTTRPHVIMCTMNTDNLPSPPSRPMLSDMLTVPPVPARSVFNARRSLDSLAAFAERVANGLRVSPAGSRSPARFLAPSCPPLRALAWGIRVLPFAWSDAEFSTVVSLL